MTFSVRITEQAHADIERNTLWWAANHSVQQAVEWQDCVYRQLSLLGGMPESYSLAQESGGLGIELRQKTVGLGKGNYRAIFKIQESIVTVLAVRRAAQDDLSTDEIRRTT